MQQNEEAQRDELFGQSSVNKSGRVNLEERRRQRAAAQRNAASHIGNGLAGVHSSPSFFGFAILGSLETVLGDSPVCHVQLCLCASPCTDTIVAAVLVEESITHSTQ